jgi:23S rRNA (adenine2503-C2)-methyltransferase
MEANPQTTRPDARALSREELERVVAAAGERAFRARQIFRWLHQRGAASFAAMTDLPRPLRERLERELDLPTLETDLAQRSSDGTIKFRFRTRDGRLLESVYMPEESRRTLCVSTQVGCAMGCAFCMTATMGLVRNLSAGEIVDQVHRVNAALLAEGLPNKAIAGQLGISRKTVGNHIEHIYTKLAVTNRAGAAMRAMHYGIVGSTPAQTV